MPRYDYSCATNGRTIEVSHAMSECVETWRDLCEKADIELDGTPPDAPVVKELSTGTRVESAGHSKDFSLQRSCACGHAHGCSGQ